MKEKKNLLLPFFYTYKRYTDIPSGRLREKGKNKTGSCKLNVSVGCKSFITCFNQIRVSHFPTEFLMKHNESIKVYNKK